MQATQYYIYGGSRVGDIYKDGYPTGFSVEATGNIVDSSGEPTGYRLGNRTFYDSDDNDTGFYLGGCLASSIYGPSRELPWM